MLRMQVLKEIMEKKPEYLCIGLLEHDEIMMLLTMNQLGIIKHMLFLECDAVECYIHVIWRDKK